MQRPANQGNPLARVELRGWFSSETEPADDTTIAATMRDAVHAPARCVEEQMEVVLLPEGQVAFHQEGTMTLAAGATWEALGHVRQGADNMSFVRAEIRGAIWSTLVASEWLDERNPSPPVTLKQQTESHEPLSGWNLFC